MVETGYRL